MVTLRARHQVTSLSLSASRGSSVSVTVSKSTSALKRRLRRKNTKWRARICRAADSCSAKEDKSAYCRLRQYRILRRPRELAARLSAWVAPEVQCIHFRWWLSLGNPKFLYTLYTQYLWMTAPNQDLIWLENVSPAEASFEWVSHMSLILALRGPREA